MESYITYKASTFGRERAMILLSYFDYYFFHQEEMRMFSLAKSLQKKSRKSFSICTRQNNINHPQKNEYICIYNNLLLSWNPLLFLVASLKLSRPFVKEVIQIPWKIRKKSLQKKKKKNSFKIGRTLFFWSVPTPFSRLKRWKEKLAVDSFGKKKLKRGKSEKKIEVNWSFLLFMETKNQVTYFFPGRVTSGWSSWCLSNPE